MRITTRSICRDTENIRAIHGSSKENINEARFDIIFKKSCFSMLGVSNILLQSREDIVLKLILPHVLDRDRNEDGSLKWKLKYFQREMKMFSLIKTLARRIALTVISVVSWAILKLVYRFGILN